MPLGSPTTIVTMTARYNPAWRGKTNGTACVMTAAQHATTR